MSLNFSAFCGKTNLRGALIRLAKKARVNVERNVSWRTNWVRKRRYDTMSLQKHLGRRLPLPRFCRDRHSLADSVVCTLLPCGRCLHFRRTTPFCTSTAPESSVSLSSRNNHWRVLVLDWIRQLLRAHAPFDVRRRLFYELARATRILGRFRLRWKRPGRDAVEIRAGGVWRIVPNEFIPI